MAQVRLPAEVELHPEALAFLNREHRLYIGGGWVEAHSGESLESINPATGQMLTDNLEESQCTGQPSARLTTR